MFWLVALLLLLAIPPIARDPIPERRSASVFLYAFAAAQLVYFYGRSHDHNLLNLSGIWLLILFVGLDRLRHCGMPAAVPALCGSLLVMLASVSVGKSALPKLDLVLSRLRRGVLLEPFAQDLEIDRAPDLFASFPKDRVFLFSRNDAYYNYRYGLRQIGYPSPLQAAVLADPTATFVRELLRTGYTVVLVGGAREDLTEDLTALNSTRSMIESGQRFVLAPTGGPLTEVRLAPR